MMSLKSFLPTTITYCQRLAGFRAARHLSKTRNMAAPKPDHLERTQDNTRQKMISSATVTALKNLSPTVKMVELEVGDKDFFFKPGQWLDMMIPGVETVGGYSMASAPHLLASKGQLHLAVKYATHPPAYWIHTKCKEGDKVDIRAGGDFFYYPEPGTASASEDLLLLAGGVGINPLYSILQHFVHLHPDSSARLALLYSARTEEELIFKDDLLKICKENKNLHLDLHCTRGTSQLPNTIKGQRINLSDVKTALTFVEKSKTSVFICGPGSFIKTMETYSLKSDIPQANVKYETWW